ncbi:helix-turn-helix domain-containing protein [Streptococcus suis]|nr:helix-turn-helix transcriptional regulator [Streptococcus suis]
MFSKKLKELRLEAGLTQKQIATELGISQQAYARWENNSRKPNLSTLEMFSEFFQVPIQEFLSDRPLSIEQILSTQTITYKDKELSAENFKQLKDFIQELVYKD